VRPLHRLLAIWFVALLVRLLYLWQVSHAPFFDLRLGDAQAYHAWAQRIAGGEWLGRDVFYQAPLYPYFLALIYRTLGDSVVIVRLIQACIGATSCALLAAAGTNFFGRAGALAGVALAVYPPAIFLDGLLDKSALVTFFVCALLALVAVPRERLTRRRALATGIVLGLLSLTRENALLLAVPILVASAFRRKIPGAADLPPEGGSHRSVNCVAAFIVGCVVILLPIALRNYAVGGGFHLTTAQLGPNFYIGNHAGASGSYEALVVGHGSAADEREDATQLAEQAGGRSLRPEEVSAFWRNRALEYIRTQPLDWLKLMATKTALIFNAAEISDTESQDVYAEWSWLLRILRPFDFGVLLGIAVLGAVLTSSSWRRLWVLYALALTYAISVVLFFVVARYRFPIVPILLLCATGGLVELVASWKTSRRMRLAGGAAAAILAVAFTHLPLENTRAARAAHYAGIATALSTSGRAQEAVEFYGRALTEAPEFPGAHFGLGTLLARMGRPAEAIPHYQSAIRSWPAHAEAHYNLGLALAAENRWDAAAGEYVEALRLRPDDSDAHAALAKVLLAQQRPGDALQHYERALVLRPRSVQALVGRGVALSELDRPGEAIASYQLALQIDPENAAAHNSLGVTLANAGRLAEALSHFERAVALNPADENARKNLERARQMLR
jgi:tetratricopeptide (TPR) repeat protein